MITVQSRLSVVPVVPTPTSPTRRFIHSLRRRLDSYAHVLPSQERLAANKIEAVFGRLANRV